MKSILRRLLFAALVALMAYDLVRLRDQAAEAEVEQAWREAEAEGLVIQVRPADQP
ncbi:MAG: hypothetical protein HYS27_14635 [Deltaproteobacteria bacterium]|nr:hypothetical protein [Deltaproteobacteria bacterium]